MTGLTVRLLVWCVAAPILAIAIIVAAIAGAALAAGRLLPRHRTSVYIVPTDQQCTPRALRRHPGLRRLDKHLDRIDRHHANHH